METTTTATQTIIDMTTTDGLIEHLSTLPSENLAAIASRPIFDVESAKMIAAAGMILDARNLLA